MNGCVRLVCITFLVSAPSWGQCDADEDEDRREAISLVSGYVANFEAIEIFDVGWRHESQWVGDNGAIAESIVRGRLKVDPVANVCCSVVDKSFTNIARSDDGAIEQRQVAVQAVVFDGADCWGRQFPEGAYRVREPSIETALVHGDAVYVQAIGLIPFPIPYGQSKHFVDHVDYLRHGAYDVSMLGGKAEEQTIKIEMPRKLFTTVRSYNLDRTTMVPKSMSESSVLQDRSIVVRARERYRFEEKEGLYVPVEIIGEKRRTKRVEGKSVPGVESYEVELRWFSVNKPLDKEFFNSQMLIDMEQVASMVAPSIFSNSSSEED